MLACLTTQVRSLQTVLERSTTTCRVFESRCMALEGEVQLYKNILRQVELLSAVASRNQFERQKKMAEEDEEAGTGVECPSKCAS